MFYFAERYIKLALKRAGLKENRVKTDDYNMHYYDSASNKEVIVLVHGLGASTEFQWYKQIVPLSKKYRVILVNLLHYGKSRSYINSGHQIGDQILYLEAVRKHLKLDKFILGGLSYGGLVCAEYTHSYPQHIEQLVLVDAAVKHLSLEHLQGLCDYYGAKDLKDFFAPKKASGLKRQLQAARHKKHYVPKFLLRSIHKNITQPNLANWECILDNLLNDYEKLAARQYKFDQKISIFWGRHDKIIPLSTGRALYEQFEQSKLFIFEKSGHLPNLEEPKKFNRALLNQLK